MPTDKQQALATVNALPDDATLEEIVYHLHVVASIGAGLADIEAGRTVSHEDVKAEVAKWLDG